ncbi:hypothetical protein HDU85_007833 [Gaertneriomyces sp. JEL0708]|nr:hypothetical protein HDU85_007833 [Gaertneriomyces sp. JEL0708]
MDSNSSVHPTSLVAAYKDKIKFRPVKLTDKPDSFAMTSLSMSDGIPNNLLFHAVTETKLVVSNKFEKTTYCILVQIAEDVGRALTILEGHLAQCVTDAPQSGFKKFTLQPICKDQDFTSFWLKLPVTKNGKSFVCTSNIRLSTTREMKELEKPQSINVTCQVNGWFNTKDKKYGLTLKPLHLDFMGISTKQSKTNSKASKAFVGDDDEDDAVEETESEEK